MAYSKTELDELTSKFEKAADRVEASKGSAVKLRAAERDLLCVAEAVRDLCQLAVGGKKDLLAEVFGGTCEHIGRILLVLDSVELSDMHADDQRWEGCKNQVGAVKQILEDLGSFKPWSISKKVPAPADLAYRGRKVYKVGEEVDVEPHISGRPDQWRVEPALPDGLELNPTTGRISGKAVGPSASSYVITASNQEGETSATLNLTIKAPVVPPTDLTYASIREAYTVGEDVDMDPQVAGGPEQWRVEPALPEGMQLDAATGRISGKPTAAAATRSYVITASNQEGETSTALTFAVKAQAPSDLTYGSMSEVHTVGEELDFRPQVAGGADQWRVEPALPEGMQLDATTGRIFGTPMGPTAQATYVITASNQEGETSTALTFGVKAQVPKDLIYPGIGEVYTVGEDVNIEPQVSGGADQWRVEPALPEGMELDATTGRISGKPTCRAANTSYVVTAANEEGETTVGLSFMVKAQVPKDLTYPDVGEVYTVGEEVNIEPQVSGDVAQWRVEPALPEGMELDATTGRILGKPKCRAENTSYVVTAANEEGETAASLSFTVKAQAPKDLTYPGISEVYTVGEDVNIEPQVSGGADKWRVEPALPEGMELDATTGRISGQPTETAEKTSYVVTASNEEGDTSAELAFMVKVPAPSNLTYPSIGEVYTVGEDVDLTPQIAGEAQSWGVEPALPEGMQLEAATGRIFGKPTVTAAKASYVVTASNQEGETSAALTFMITAPVPEGLSYPTAGSEYLVGTPVDLEPEIISGVCGTYSVTPALPAGLNLDTTTGVVSGTPEVVAEECEYTITLSNIAGSTAANIKFAVSEEETETFASMVEAVTDIAELKQIDPKVHGSGYWMLWMVHRAWLDDPELTVLDFSGKSMPLGHQEPRIAPKLMKAMAHNTNMTELRLNNSNVQKPEGHLLAESLGSNKTLEVLDLQSNNLDSETITTIAQAIGHYPESNLQEWKFYGQKCLGGSNFGRQTEEALATMLEKNTKLLKLGVSMDDPHWRGTVDRLLMRNNDRFRRQRKALNRGATGIGDPEVVPQDRTLSKLLLQSCPDKPAREVFEDDDSKLSLARKSVAASKKLPTGEQLQSFAKNAGQPLKFSEVAPLLKDFRSRLLKASIETEVTVTDSYLSGLSGTLTEWSESNERWLLEVWPDAETRLHYKSDKQIVIEITDEVAQWIS